MSIFIDTSAFLAVINREDEFHLKATKIWENINKTEQRLICSNYVIVETIALLQKRFGIDAIRIFHSNIQPILNVIWVDEALHHAGMVIVLTSNHRKLSLVDCTSFEIIRNYQISQVFTFDTHFTDQGFHTLSDRF